MEININSIKEKAERIFTQDNLPEISWFLNQCKTIPQRFTGDSEFETVVIAAKFDSQEDFIKSIINKIQS